MPSAAPVAKLPPSSTSFPYPIRFGGGAFVRGLCSSVQWAELVLLLVNQRLVRKLTSTTDEAEAQGGEAERVRETCSGMALRLSELDPMHGRFYEFIEQGGSVWGVGKATLRRTADVDVAEERSA